MKTYRTIQVAGFTNKNTATLWDGRGIITATSYDVEDFDFALEAEKELENCKNFIKKMEKEKGWIEGYVTCWIDEITPETVTYSVYDTEDIGTDECVESYDTEDEAMQFVDRENAAYGFKKFFYKPETN